MPNLYTSAYAPMALNAEYQMPNTQALQQQQLFQNAMAQQQQGLVNEAGQVQGGGGGGLNPLAMAAMLRKPQSTTDFLTSNYTAPSVGINPDAKIGYNIDSMSTYGLK